MTDVLLQMSGITKAFPGVLALDDASLTIRAGEIHGLVGENGAGKSTIIKSLAGVYQHDHGAIHFAGDEIPQITAAVADELGIRFVHQELHLVPHFTVAESVFMGQELSDVSGLNNRKMREQAALTLSESLGAEINPRALIRDLTPAERKLVQIARALVREGTRLIVFDEPTAPLASAEVERVLQAIRRLKKKGIAVLYVSHYLGEINQLCDAVTVFRNGSDVGLIENDVAQSGRELIRLMVGRDLDQLFPTRDSVLEEVFLDVKQLSDGDKFQDVSFSIHAGEIVGLAGVLGSGCEEIVDAIVGLRRAKSGSLTVRGQKARIASPAAALRKGIVLIPRDRRNDGLFLELSVRENINIATLESVATAGLVSREASEKRARLMVEQLDIRPAETERQGRYLSGGNQQKVVLARSLAADAKILVLDEPTVGVDIGAKTEIYRQVSDLAVEGRAVLISSNDPAEILGLCDRVYVVIRGTVVSEHRSEDLTRDSLIEKMTQSTEKAGSLV
jgi:ribose transport system ATP-binding protein